MTNQSGRTDEFDRIAACAWQQTKPPLELFWDGMVGEGNWEDTPDKPAFFKLTGSDGPIPCCICDRVDQWVLEADGVWVCEHEPIYGIIRQLDSKTLKDVTGWEML